MKESKDKPKNVSLTKLMRFNCKDIDCPIEGNSPEYHCCQYCWHIPDSETKKHPSDWKCELPNREAQRSQYADMDNKQQVLI